MAALFNDYRESTIKEPLIQHPGGDLGSKGVENGEPTGAIFGANLTAVKPQEPNVELFADSVKYSQGTSSDAVSINGI